MNIHSLTILHYGMDYLPYALQSVYNQVDHCHVFYTPTPSHGHKTNTPPPETKSELIAAAFKHNPDDKVSWYDMLNVTHEGPQRDMALQTVEHAGADLVLVVDYDEIWAEKVLRDSLAQAIESGARNNLVNMIHLWRSFNWACHDQGWPVRIINLQHKDGVKYLDRGKVYHFGYAIRDEILRYKIQIHGHKNELRHNWYDTKWVNWKPDITDVHPTNDKGFWQPQPFDKSQLPEFMKQHPFYHLERIK